MKGIICFEESQAVTKAFRELGHEFYSNDKKPCSGGHPDWHLQINAVYAMDTEKWDFIGLHCECTKLAVSGNRWYAGTPERQKAIDYTKAMFDKACSIAKYVYLENPIGALSTAWRKPDQIIQPWMFGHKETKATCLWNVKAYQ